MKTTDCYITTGNARSGYKLNELISNEWAPTLNLELKQSVIILTPEQLEQIKDDAVSEAIRNYLSKK